MSLLGWNLNGVVLCWCKWCLVSVYLHLSVQALRHPFSSVVFTFYIWVDKLLWLLFWYLTIANLNPFQYNFDPFKTCLLCVYVVSSISPSFICVLYGVWRHLCGLMAMTSRVGVFSGSTGSGRYEGSCRVHRLEGRERRSWVTGKLGKTPRLVWGIPKTSAFLYTCASVFQFVFLKHGKSIKR